MTAYFTALDHEEHESGPFSAGSLAVLERIDAIVGTLVAAAERTDPGNAIVCVVSDHGFVSTRKVVNLFAAFRSAGLMAFDEKNKPTSWQATPWAAGGSAAIVINPVVSAETRAEVRSKVADLLQQLAADPANGIAQVLDADALHARGGFPDAAFLVDMKPGTIVFDTGINIQQAIALAGGLNERGSDRRIKVSRLVNGKLTELTVNLEDKIQPGDTITISGRFF
jgi:hypothetical protein